MEELLIAAAGVLVGLVGTAIAGRYYFMRSLDMRLTAYVFVARFALFFNNDAVRSRIRLLYRDVEIGDLFELQLLIINNGTRALRGFIQPPRLLCTARTELLEAEVIHVHPSGREVVATADISAQGAAVTFNFPLLNSGEYFLTRLLFKGRVTFADLSLTVIAEDLPPKLDLLEFPADLPFRKPYFSWDLLLMGILSMALAMAWSILIVTQWPGAKTLFGLSVQFSPMLASVAWFIACFGAVVLFSAGGLMVVHSGMRDLFRKRAILLPEELARGAGWAQPWIGFKEETSKSAPCE